MQVLIVEDAPRIRRFLVQGLTEEGFSVEATGDLATARQLIENTPPDLIIIDRMLPDGDGLDLVRELRRSGNTLPAICLTARDRVEERVEGLRSGADDYLVKPFSFDELLARIEAIQRRSSLTDEIIPGRLKLEPAERRVWVSGEPVELTGREFDVLAVLCRTPGRAVSRARLLDQAWGDQFDRNTNVVDVYIGYLRKKLGAGLIATVRGIGYRLEIE